MACNCIGEINEHMEAKGLNTEIGTSLFRSFIDNPDGTREIALSLRVEIASYVKEKKRGAKAMRIAPLYCPLCGRAYAAEKAEPVPADNAGDQLTEGSMEGSTERAKLP